MKNILITLVSLLILMVTLSNLQAQEKETKHEVHLQIKKIIDGKETMVDSVFTIDGDTDLSEIMKSLGQEDVMGQLQEITDEFKGKKKVRVEKKITKEISTDEDTEEEQEVKVEVIKEVDDKEEIIIKQGGDDEDIRIKIEGGDSDKNVFIFESEDGKVFKLDGKEAGDVVIIKDKDVDIEEIEEGEGKKSKKVIRIKTDGDDAGEGDAMIWHSDDGEVIKMDGKDVQKDMIIIRKKDGEDLEDIDIEKLREQLKEKGIEWNEKDGDNVFIKKSSSINIQIDKPEDADWEGLQKAGLNKSDLNSGLEIDELKASYQHEGLLMLAVETEESGHLTAVVRDSDGEVVSKTVLKESPDTYKIYLNLDQSGSYYVTLSQGGKSLTQKLVIKKE